MIQIRFQKLLGHLADAIMVMLILTFVWFLFHPIDTSVHYPAQIVTKVNTVPASRTDAAAHDQILLNIITAQSAISQNILNAYDNAKNQVRFFYSAIIAALLTVMFTVSAVKRDRVAVVALLVIASMYMLEVSFADLSNRQVAKNTALGLAQDTLSDLMPSDSTWYSLDYSAHVSQADSASGPAVRRYRKIALALQPNLEQFVYYVIPFILFLVCRCWINTVHLRLKRRLTGVSK